MERYPKWKADTPHTDPNAKVSQLRFVQNVRAIRVENASYRNAPLTGVFELDDSKNVDPVKTQPAGKEKAKVVCAWHGVTPRTSYPKLDLSIAKYEVLNNYTGEVVDNIS